jgi:class 3 adenylate cyclase
LEFLLLGPLLVRDDEGRELPLPSRKQRALLALLLLHAGEVVSRDRLLEALWPEGAPETAVTALQGHVSRVRKLLGPGRLLTQAPGYRLELDKECVDVSRFERLLADALQSRVAPVRAERLRSALSLWRGQPLPEFESEAFVHAEVERLDGLWAMALEERTAAELEAGQAAELVPELEALVRARPFRERLRAQLMLALYRSGRQAEALEVYRVGRELLVEELGVEPGPELQQLQRRILGHDRSLSPAAAAAATDVARAEPRGARQRGDRVMRRKVVSVLFCDVVGSTTLGEAIDPEALQAVLARYFERMKAIVERHGGSVEKFIGDAVMAVFGVPTVHEDDALRACRVALEMRDSFPDLGVEGRIGVNSGEVVTGTEERLATGDALNVAARLQQAAAPGEVLLGQATLDLVGDGVDVEPIEPLQLKGKSEPVPAFRLVALGAMAGRAFEGPFVGRARELALIHDAWARALAEKRCELVTIVGDAGLGKSRLIEEALGSLEARTVRGRCLPYGDGITYWPLVEALKQFDGLPADPVAAAALSSLLGASDETASGEEIAWAFRKLLAEQAPLASASERCGRARL